jgi:predicted ATP-grasp superfamily ATP-dependent carboligase
MKQEEGKLSGLEAVDISWDGKDEDGAAKISLTVIEMSGNKGLLLIYWASPDGEKKHLEELHKIAQSIKKA